MTQIRDSLFIITGAASGIGQSVAIAAARDGAYVLATDMDRVGLDQTAAAVQRTGGKVDVVRLDVGDAAQVETFARQVARSFPQHRIILLNNAEVSLGSGTFVNNRLDDFEWLLNTNLWGVVRMSRAFLPLMQQRPGSHIANVSGVSGICGPPGTAAYSTAKFAVRGFTNVLRSELVGAGIRVSTVFPGGVRTNIAATSRPDGGRTEAQKVTVAQQFAGRLTTSPEQAAKVILKGIGANRARILIGFDARLTDWITRLLPSRCAPPLLTGISETFLPKEALNLKSTSTD